LIGNRVNNDLAINLKDASKKTIARFSCPEIVLGHVLAPPSLLYLKITFIQEVKSRLRTSVIKEGTASGKHKEYRCPCIACPHLAFAAFARVAR